MTEAKGENEIASDIPPDLEAFFLKRVGKTGSVPTAEELKKFCDLRGMRVPRRLLVDFRRRYVHLAVLSNAKRRPRVHASIGIPRYGIVFTDLFFFRKNWKGYNAGVHMFGLGIEASTKQLAAFPMRGKTAEHWREFVRRVITESVFDTVRIICSDREPALVSRNFRTRLQNEHGTRIVFLRRKSKSYLAETAGRWVKTALARACAQRKEDGEPDYRKWTKFLPDVVSGFNSKPASAGSDFRRKDVNRDNYARFMNQKWGDLEDYTMRLNTRTLDADAIDLKRKDALFRLPLGCRVLALKRSLETGEKDREGAFFKPSVTGGYSATVFVVARRLLATSSDPGVMVPGANRTLPEC